MLQSQPVVAVYVRHKPSCPKQKHGEFYHACECPKWLRYSFNGKQHRLPAETRSWNLAEERANEKQHQLDAGTDTVIEHGSEKPTIKQAVEMFITGKNSQEFQAGTVAKYQNRLNRFDKFMSARSRFYPADVRLEDLEAYRATWKQQYPSSGTRQQVQTQLRSFLRYCYEAGWMTKLPKLSPIKVTETPTLPLSEDEYTKLLENIPVQFPDSAKAQKVRALVQLMRHSGLSIRDAVTLERSEIQHDSKLKLHRIVTSRQKTGTHVSVLIPPDVAKEVLAVLNGNPRYVFWNTGTGKEQSVVTNWQHDLRALFRGTFGQDTDFTPHCLRDTAAVEWLSAGIPMEEVSKLLGHESIRVTEQSYAKWAVARQDRLDSLVVTAWKQE